MLIILLVLFVTGFFFPPIWLGLLGYLIYIFSSRKSRRDGAVEARVKKLIQENRSHGVFADLHFEAARSYAMAKGAQSPEQDAASTTIIVNGRSYFVTFMMDVGGGTAISARDSRAVEIEIERDLEERLDSYGISESANRTGSGQQLIEDPAQFVESFVLAMDSIGKASFDKASKKPSWIHDKEKVRELTSYMVFESVRRGISETYTVAISLQEDFLNAMFACVATADSQGFSFEFQKKVGISFVERCWIKLSEEYKDKFREITLDAEGVEMLSSLNKS